MSDHDNVPRPIRIDATDLGVGSIFIAADPVPIRQPDIIRVLGEGGALLIAVHPDGSMEYGPAYEPDEAARAFWDAVEQHARIVQYGAPLNARINAHLKDGHEAEQTLEQVRGEVAGMCNCCANNRPHLARIQELLGVPDNSPTPEEG